MSMTSPISLVSDNCVALRVFLFDLLKLVSFDRSYLFDDESDNDWSGSGSAGTCAFTFHFNESIGHVGDFVGRISGMGSVVFVLTGIESIGETVLLIVFVTKGVEPKGRELIEIFLRPKSCFPLLVLNIFCDYSFVLTSSSSFQPLYFLQKHDSSQTSWIHPSVFWIW